MFRVYRAEGDVTMKTNNDVDWGGGGTGYQKYGDRGIDREIEGERGRDRERYEYIWRDK